MTAGAMRKRARACVRKEGCVNNEDDPRSVRPSTAATDNDIERGQSILMIYECNLM
ncbi:hypothetical protein J6590_034365 [Homalodisca vitripennis]|nr:hypothetical protein J6590_034365 [Homalodisca vitripennis]